MFSLKECPYCKTKNHIHTEDWERVMCPGCNGVFYVEIQKELIVTKFDNNGIDVEPTTKG